MVGFRGRMTQAHRAAFILATGITPKSRHEHVMHSCNQKLCINPGHLSLGTAAKNMVDAAKDGLLQGRKRHGFSREEVLEIRASAERPTKLAIRYGVSLAAIWKVRNRHSYAYW